MASTIRKGFRFDNVSKPKDPLPKPRPEDFTIGEVLTGEVNGRKASDLEERLARAFRKYGIPFRFQFSLATAYSFPGEEKQIDFIINGNQPVEPDGYIGHFATIGQRAKDRIRDGQLNQIFIGLGFKPIHHIHYRYLGTQEDADAYVRRNFA